jgi:hypothetical protein
MAGGDGGFVRTYMNKFQTLAIKAQKRQPVDDALAALVKETRDRAAQWKSDFAPDALLARIAGQLNVAARATELPDLNLPGSQNSSIVKARERGDFLRKAAKMLTGSA